MSGAADELRDLCDERRGYHDCAGDAVDVALNRAASTIDALYEALDELLNELLADGSGQKTAAERKGFAALASGQSLCGEKNNG